MPIEIIGHPSLQNKSTDESSSSKAAAITTANTKTQDTAKATTSDTLSITNSAELLRHMENIIAKTPEVDMQRVENIQNALSNGSYSFDSTRVAEKMLLLETALAA